MADITSAQSGNWSATATWTGGAVPADGDNVTIASGHTVVFDVDQSSFTTGINLVITGTLNHTTASGSYCMKLKTGAAVTGAGTWNIGTSGTPIPYASKHLITGVAGWYVDGNAGLTLNVYGAEPSYKYVKLSAAEAAGQTELSVDTDLTGDIWAAGDTITINNVNRTQNTETRIIASTTSNTINVTAGLTGAKIAGTVICLLTRNVRIVAVGTGTRTIYRVGSTDKRLTIGGGEWRGVGKYMMDSCPFAAVSGGAFIAASRAFNACGSMTITGGVFSAQTAGAILSSDTVSISGGVFAGENSVLETSHHALITGGEYYGLYNGICTSSNGAVIKNITERGSANGFLLSNSMALYNCTIDCCMIGLRECNSPTLSGCTISNFASAFDRCNLISVDNCTLAYSNSQALYVTTGKLSNTAFVSVVLEHKYYTSMFQPAYNCQSVNHNQSAGALKAWCKGGVITSQTSVKPAGYVRAYLHALESAAYPAFWTLPFAVAAGKSVTLEVQLRKDASMTYLPRVYLMVGIGNPLIGSAALETFTMTDAVDTWESHTFTVANTDDYEKQYTLYFVAQNATGNAYSAYKFTAFGGGSGSAGAVRILPNIGKVGL